MSSLGSSSEVHTRKMRRSCNSVTEIRPRARQKIADPWRKPRLLGYFEDEPVGQGCRAGRLPQTHVAHNGGCDAEVPTNGGKVEGSDSCNEPLQAPPLNAVPNVGRMEIGLFLVERN